LHLTIYNILDLGCAVMLETYRPTHKSGERDRDQHTGQLGCKFFQPEHDGKGRHPDKQGRQMGVADLQQHPPDVLDEVFATPHRDTEQLVELGQTNDQRSGIGEADDHRMRKKIDHDTELERPQHELNDADNQRHQNRQRNELAGAGSCQRRQGGSGQQRNHRHRPSGKLRRRSPQRCDDARQKRRIETIIRR